MKNAANNGVSNGTVLFVITIASFLITFMGSSVNIALPSIGKELSVGAVSLAWVTTSYILSVTVFLLPLGRVADMYGRKRIFTYGTLIYTLSSLLLATASNSAMLISFRALQGMGGAMILGNGLAIMTSVFPIGERGRALGINTAAVYVGLSIGPFLGGLLTQNLGWRSIFWTNALLGLIVIFIVLWRMRGEWTEVRAEKFDLGGSIIYGIAAVAVVYGFSALPAVSGLVVVLIGILGVIMFIWWETKVAIPILDINLFRNNRVFAFSNLANLINYSATFAIAFLLSLYLQYAKGFSPQSAGLVLVSIPAVQAFFSPIAGRLSDRTAPRILTSSGIGVTTIGITLLTFVNQDTGIGFILVSLIILGFGLALFSTPNVNAIMSSIDKKVYGVASATLITMRQVGMMLSMGIVMLIFAIHIGRTEITPEYYPAFVDSMRIALGIFAALCFTGIFASLAKGRGQ